MQQEPEVLEKLKKEPEELEKLEKFFVKVLKQRLKQKKTLPYWKYWKKTERLTKLPIKLPEKVRILIHTRGGEEGPPGGGGGGGMFEVNVSAGGLLEVCWRSAGGLPKGVGACGKTPPMEVCRRSAGGCVGA